MEERCGERNCSLGSQMRVLENQFKDFQNQNSANHREIFKRLGELEQISAVQDERDKTINEKLDKLILWQEEEKKKPGRLLDRLIEGGLLAVIGGLIGFILG